MDRADLIDWIHEAQRKERDWRRRFRSFYRDIREWHEHLSREAEKPDPESSKPRSRVVDALNRLSPEILEAPDPLEAILTAHAESSREQDGFF